MKGAPIPLQYEKWMKQDGTYVYLPIPEPSCVHTWTPDKGPRATMYTPPKHYAYFCSTCAQRYTSTILIPQTPVEDDTCQHEWKADPKLGVAYSMFYACSKCGKQKKME